MLAAAALTTLSACEKENTFVLGQDEGRLDCRSLKVDYANRENTVSSRSVDLGDFEVNFINTATGETARSFKYSEMPEVVALPVGNYHAEASYGDNPVAEWDAPFYLGNSTFKIEANKITDNVDPISCRLSNIKVTIDFNDEGSGKIGDDAIVVVSAGQEGSLTFTKTGENAGRTGYFRYIEGSTTLTATFSGTVDGKYVEGETKAYDNATSGNHYKINFSVHSADNTEPGGISGTINVDGNVTVIDQNETVDPNDTDREYKTDDMRPVEDENQGSGDEPGPDDPIDPTPGEDDNLPKAVGNEFNMNEVYVVDASSPCSFTVTSSHPDGFTGFDVEIVSNTLTPEELSTVGLTDKFNLINPGEYAEILTNLGFPVNLGGLKSADFNMSGFMMLLQALGSGDHKFVLTVTDGHGTSVNTVWLRFTE